MLHEYEGEIRTSFKPRAGRFMSNDQRVVEGDDPVLAEVVGADTDGLFAT